jgi:hypothetical protein
MYARTWALSAVICFSFLAGIALVGCGGQANSSPSQTPSPPAPTPTLSLSATPNAVSVTPGVSFHITVMASESATTATPMIILGTLPAGLTTASTFPMSVPSGGATIAFTTSATIPAGSFTVAVSGTASTATTTTSIPFTVVTTPPGEGGLLIPLFREVEIHPGSSASVTSGFHLNGFSIYDVALNVTGLPTGVTATISPQVVGPGDSFTVTLTASTSAPTIANAQWSIVGTPAADVPEIRADYLLDIVSSSGGAGWTNRTTYVSTRATPFSAVYDSAHQMIYSANQVWNRIDVISDKTRSIVNSIPIRDPRGMDISVDGSTIWVGTGSQVMYGINTSTQKATFYQLPFLSATSTYAYAGSWEGEQVLSLADGTVLLIVSNYTGSGSAYAAIWNPSNNALTQLTTPSPTNWGVYTRSQDGKHVFILGSDENETSYTYDVATGAFTTTKSLSSFGYATLAASNVDGSRVAVADDTGFTLYDGNLNKIGALPGDGGAFSFPAENQLFGGFVFSPDGTRIYEETESTVVPLIITIDVATQQAIALSPAMPVIPTFTELSPAYDMPMPFAIDSAGMLLGVQYHGIAFDDSTVNFNLSSSTPGSPIFMQHMLPYSGPLSGGTTSGGFGDGLSLTPDVYYGATKGVATLSSNSLSITSPPTASSGPVDVKILFPDGNEVYNPQFFSYGTQIQDALISGGTPQGGTAAKLDAFGLPLDPTQDKVTVGGAAATVTSSVTQYPPFTGEQTDMFLSYTAPAGSPGWANLTVTTPNGTGTLPKAFFYAKSVNDYAMTDSPTFVLYDGGRNQLYLSAGAQIDVFSLSSHSFLTPLSSPVSGSQFQGLTLTPDGKTLLAADLTNGAVAVINPDSPSGSFEIGLSGSKSGYNSCTVGPLFVVADNQGNALVTSGAVVGTPSCGPQTYPLFLANLATKSGASYIAKNCTRSSASFLSASHDGSLIGMAGPFNIYLPAKQACIPVAQPTAPYAVTVSGDGNVLGLDRAFADSAGNILGRFADPQVFYPSASPAEYYNYSPYQDGALQNPTLNDAGSLYYWAYPNYVDIVDVQHGIPAMRFGLTETVTNTVAPMAIDGSGQHIFLITNAGLTVVDLGSAPLSIGHMSQTAASPGTQITIRGSGFETGITTTLGGVSAATAFTDSETITITIPTTNSGLEDLVLSNPDGTTYTLQNAISVQ